MKATGIVRSLDSLGRLVLPIELRRLLSIDAKEARVEIYVDEDKIVLRKYSPACIFCGSTDEIADYQGRNICKACRHSISGL